MADLHVKAAKKFKHKTRQEYYQLIWKYEKRRKSHHDIAKRLTTKIKGFKQRIREIDRRADKIKFLVKSINDYFDVKIESKSLDNDHRFARNVYYKIGIEVLAIQGSRLSSELGKSYRMATKGRMAFTRSFKTRPANSKKFHQFKKYFEDEIKRSGEAIK